MVTSIKQTLTPFERPSKRRRRSQKVLDQLSTTLPARHKLRAAGKLTLLGVLEFGLHKMYSNNRSGKKPEKIRCSRPENAGTLRAHPFLSPQPAPRSERSMG